MRKTRSEKNTRRNTQQKDMKLGLVTLYSFMIFSLFLFSCRVDKNDAKENPPIAVNGIIDLKSWNFQKNGPAKLTGDWKISWHKLINNEVAKNFRNTQTTQSVPSSWSHPDFKDKGNNDGYATYMLRLDGLRP